MGIRLPCFQVLYRQTIQENDKQTNKLSQDCFTITTSECKMILSAYVFISTLNHLSFGNR